MNALVIINDAAGSVNGEKDAVTVDAVRATFAECGVEVTARRAPSKTICDALKSAVAARPDVLFVGGGDGTISTAASCLVDTGVPLGVLPLGTLNHFAKDLGVPTEWREAAKALVAGRRQAVDVGEVNGRIFINNCSLGSYPEAVHERDRLRREHGAGRWWAMFVATVRVFRRLRRMRLQIAGPEMDMALRTPFVFVGNNAYTGHVLAQSLRPRLDEGRLWIYTTRARRRLTLVRLAWQTLVRDIDSADALEAHAVTTATITSQNNHPIPAAADGELLPPSTELRLRIRPKALQVIVPRDPPAA